LEEFAQVGPVFRRELDLVQGEHLKENFGFDLARFVLVDVAQQRLEVRFDLVGFEFDVDLGGG